MAFFRIQPDGDVLEILRVHREGDHQGLNRSAERCEVEVLHYPHDLAPLQLPRVFDRPPQRGIPPEKRCRLLVDHERAPGVRHEIAGETPPALES